MSDVFLSYGRKELEIAEQVVRALEMTGLSVFWDHQIQGGEIWADQIARQLEAAACVVVIWSKYSVGSKWVQEEARYGMELGKLVPIVVDDVEPPSEFRRIIRADLSNWDGNPADERFRTFIESIQRIVGGTSGQDKKRVD